MKTKIFALRVNRRAIGVAVLTNEGLSYVDGRHLPSGAERALAAAVRFVERILESGGTDVAIVDAPASGQVTTTDGIRARLQGLLLERGFSPINVGRPEVLIA